MISKLPEILKAKDTCGLFLLTGKSSYEKSGAEEAVSRHCKGYATTRYVVEERIPETETVTNAARAFADSGCDAIAAVGGGNVIDTAKLVNILASGEMNPGTLLNGYSHLPVCRYSLTAVPTTAGSGSEATHFAVVYSGGNKYSVAHESILPEYAIVDPELTYSLDPYNTAVSGIDALSQSVESAWACGSNHTSSEFAFEAIRLCIKSYLKAVNSPDEISRRDMAVAANLAGKAINISKTTAPHALSYTMTMKYGIPHGQAVCVTLPAIMDYNFNVEENDCSDSRGLEHVKSVITKIAGLLGERTVSDAAEKLRRIINEAGLSTSLSKLHIPKEGIQDIASGINAERMNNNPRKLTADSITDILERIY